MKIIFKYLVLLVTFVTLNFVAFSQTNTKFNQTSPLTPVQKLFSKGGDIFGTRVFVENKGQFDNSTNSSEKIYYALEDGNDNIYFTKKGLIYKQTEAPDLSEETREKIENGKLEDIKSLKSFYIQMNWIGAEVEQIEIEASQKQNHYITYGTKELNGNTFKKLLYKNVYQHIDIEYIIPEDKSSGIKYSLILYPGADLQKIKIL